MDPLPGAMSHCNYAGWGLHNCAHKEDAAVRCWNNDPGGAGLKSLKGRFVSPPERHDGKKRVKVRVAFSENIGISYRSLREDAFAVSGGRVTRGRRVDDQRDLFEMTVEPDGEGEVTVTLPAGRECGVSGAICTKGENRRQLTNAPTATVAGPAVETGAAGLTARFVDMPSEHRGEGGFRFRVAFSENIGISYPRATACGRCALRARRSGGTAPTAIARPSALHNAFFGHKRRTASTYPCRYSGCDDCLVSREPEGLWQIAVAVRRSGLFP